MSESDQHTPPGRKGKTYRSPSPPPEKKIMCTPLHTTELTSTKCECVAMVTEASILGGGGGSRPSPNENIGVVNISFCPPPPNKMSTTLKKSLCNARIGLKSTVRHYKKIDIKNTTKHNIIATERADFCYI